VITIVAGSRSVTAYRTTRLALKECPWQITCVVSGCAPGPDRHGITWARRRGIPIKRRPADWETHGDNAGKIRNVSMAYEAQALVAVWDGHSPGTRHMIATARALGLKIHIHRTK
jgi:hypothetical protein